MPTMEETRPVEVPDQDRCGQCGATGVPLLTDDQEVGAKVSPSGKPRFCNNCMIGKQVKVFWPVDQSWYTGIVQEYDSSTGEHLLRYHDGDTEWVKIGGENNAAGPAPAGGSNPMLDPIAPISPATADAPSSGPAKQPEQVASGDRKWPGEQQQMPPSLPGGQPYAGFPPGAMPYGPMVPPIPPYVMYPPQHPYGGGPMFPHPYGLPNVPPLDGTGGEGDGTGPRKTGPKSWTKEEDALLLSIVQTMTNPMKWSIVAQSLRDRTGKQCRERYVNHLNPRLKVSDWDPVEDATIFHLYDTIGSTWAKMSKAIPGRTDNGIKNRFHNLRRQYEREDENRLRLSSPEEFPGEIRLDRLRPFPEQLTGKVPGLWEMKPAIGILAAHTVLGESSGRSNSRFGPFRKGKDGDICIRCGFLVPSVQTGKDLCTKTGWCLTCSRIPPHICGNLLRECLNLRRAADKDLRGIIESWDKLVDEGDANEEQNGEAVKAENNETNEPADQTTEESSKPPEPATSEAKPSEPVTSEAGAGE